MEITTLILIGAGLIITTGISFFFVNMVNYGRSISVIKEKLQHIEEFIKERTHDEKEYDEKFYEIKTKISRLEKASSTEEYRKILIEIITETNKAINSIDLKTTIHSEKISAIQTDILIIKKFIKRHHS